MPTRQRSRKTTVGPLVSLALVGLAACSGDDDIATTTTSTTSTTVVLVEVPEVDLRASYFELLAAGTPASQAARPAISSGGDASVFAAHQTAARDLLGLPATRTVTADGEAFELCEQDGTCTIYDDVVVDPSSGVVTSFSTDGVALEGRIVGGGVVADRDGVVARVGSAYVSVSGEVFVVIEIDNTTDAPVELFGFAAVLESANGAGVEATGAWGHQQLPSGVDGQLLLEFPEVELGGQVRLSGLRGDGLDLALEIRVPMSG